jgi:uncharacterized protein YceK
MVDNTGKDVNIYKQAIKGGLKMKGNMKTMALALVVGLGLSACSTVNMPTMKSSENKVPRWFVNAEDTGNEGWYLINRQPYYYAVATAVSPDMEMALKKATLKAKAKITDRVNGEMNNRTVIEYSETGQAENPTGTTQSNDTIVNVIKDTILRTYSTNEKECYRQTDINNWRCFVSVKIPKSDIDKLITQYDAPRLAKSNVADTTDDAAKKVLGN